MPKWLATFLANGSFCSTSKTVRLKCQSSSQCQLLLSSRRVSSLPLQHFFQNGKHLKNQRRQGCFPACTCEQPSPQVFIHSESWKNLLPLWHIAYPVSCTLLGGFARKFDTFEKDFTKSDFLRSHYALQQGGLAYSVSTHQAHTGNFLDLKVHATQGMTFTVVSKPQQLWDSPGRFLSNLPQAHFPKDLAAVAIHCMPQQKPSQADLIDWHTKLQPILRHRLDPIDCHPCGMM